MLFFSPLYVQVYLSLIPLISGKASTKEDTGSIIFDMDGSIHKIIYFIKDVTDLRNIPRYLLLEA